jgi:hypothetical protein
VIRPEAGAPFSAPLGHTGQFVLLVGPREQDCPPTGPCSPAPALDTLLVVNAATGATLAQAPLTGAAIQPFALAVDGARGLADVISASAVDVYATASGAHLGTFPLPLSAVADSTSRALITSDGTLLVTARIGGVPSLVTLDARTGATGDAVVWQSESVTIIDYIGPPTGPTSTSSIVAATALSGPVYDPATGFLALAATMPGSGGASVTTLTLYNFTHHLTLGPQVASWTLPSGTQLGPLNPTNATLYVFEPGGTTASVKESALESPLPPANAAPIAPLTPHPALAGARALGWDHSDNLVYLADAAGLRVLDAASGQTIAALPLPVHQPADQALATDSQNVTVYVPTDHGALAVVQALRISLGPHAPGGMNPATAALLARAAIATLPPQNGQKPPFLTPATFTVGPGTRALNFYAYDADFGTTGPYPGTATLAVAGVGASASPPGAYNVTFTITWNLRFLHTRTWTYQVASTGAVRLLSQSGDGLPCCQTPGQTSG